MVIVWVLRYHVDKGKEREYERLGKEFSLKFLQDLPELIQLRGYRNLITDEAVTEYEFENYEAFGRYMDKLSKMDMWKAFKSIYHDLSCELLGPGLLTPEPIKPKK